MKNRKIYISVLSLTGIIALAIIGTSFAKKTDAIEKITEESTSTISAIAEKRIVSKEAKKFWYDGKAELSSYTLTQARYGETHEGTAVLVYVTEPFSKSAHTKADDYRDANNISVLKLNKTLKFNTGIYPYSMMNSTFFPLENGNASLKIASSLQEWCGATYLEMKNDANFTFDFNSYFEGFTFKNKVLKKDVLEDDLWSLIRLNPELLPVGKQQLIPSMFFLRLRNREPQAHEANISLEKKDTEGVSHYTIQYPELERELTIDYNTAFPHEIIGWEDTHYSGYGEEKKIQTSKATLLKTIKTDYWNQNHNKDSHWRAKLGL